MASKYHAKPVTVDGIRFDSKREAARYRQLKAMQEGGEIAALRRQVKYLLIDAQWATEERTDSKGRKAKPRKVCLERAVTYIADFVYIRDGIEIVEDVKGMRTDVYRIKKKLMLERYGIRITEI